MDAIIRLSGEELVFRTAHEIPLQTPPQLRLGFQLIFLFLNTHFLLFLWVYIRVDLYCLPFYKDLWYVIYVFEPQIIIDVDRYLVNFQFWIHLTL